MATGCCGDLWSMQNLQSQWPLQSPGLCPGLFLSLSYPISFQEASFPTQTSLKSNLSNQLNTNHHHNHLFISGNCIQYPRLLRLKVLSWQRVSGAFGPQPSYERCFNKRSWLGFGFVSKQATPKSAGQYQFINVNHDFSIFLQISSIEMDNWGAHPTFRKTHVEINPSSGQGVLWPRVAH